MTKKQPHDLRPLPVPRVRSNSKLARFLFKGGNLDDLEDHHSRPWYVVLWLTGVDYFSTLGYQPGIALIAAGVLSPVATLLLVAVTLFGALPVYSQVAGRSYAGQGSIAMLEHLVAGWRGKVFVLVLIGFAATDFIITMTLSAADAVQHAIENPYLHPYLGDAHVPLTLGLLVLLGVVFLKGFSEAIGLAAFVAIPFLILNLVVIIRGFMEIAGRPELLANWRLDLAGHGDWTGIFLVSAIVFPKLALGMSGFETGVTVMPLVEGKGDRGLKSVPKHRIRSTRKLLACAALIMSVMLIMSSLVTSILVPSEAYQPGGPASGRALAYLAHLMLGRVFGTLYDISTILILWFAGASAMAGLLSLIPRYLPRFGMAPRWVSYRRPLVLALLFIACIVTIVFEASVEAQGAAYATGVLVLMLSAALAVALALWREFRAQKNAGITRALMSVYFWIVSGVFVFTLVDNVIERPDGVVIAGIFILSVVIVSAVSRVQRATELRVMDIAFSDEASVELWDSLVDKKVHLVPLRRNTPGARAAKDKEIHKHYALQGPIAFVHAELIDNRSEFLSSLKVKVVRENENLVITVNGAIAIANTIAYISELINPISIFLGLTRENLMNQAMRYLLWGEGETGLMVYTILIRYWEWTPEDDIRPLIFLMSE